MPALTHHIDTAADPATLFELLIHEQAVSLWLGAATAEIERRVGGRFDATWEIDGTRWRGAGRIAQLDPPRTMVLDLLDAHDTTTSTVAIEVRTDGDRTTLTIAHDDLSEEETEAYRRLWSAWLDNVVALTEHVPDDETVGFAADGQNNLPLAPDPRFISIQPPPQFITIEPTGAMLPTRPDLRATGWVRELGTAGR